MNAPHLQTGEVVDQRYVVQRRIGAGAMGEIYLTLQRPFMRRTALKTLHPWHVDSEEVSRRFMQEAEALSRLSHPNTVTVFDFGRHEGRHFIAMEYVEGMTVGQRIREQGPMAPEDAVPLAIQVAQSLSEAHAKGIIHRDLKPDNILLSSPPDMAPFVKVVDFGIAKVLDRGVTSTHDGAIVGTPHYMAPEQASARDVGPESDIYSLGCCLFEMLTGQPPFLGDDPMEILVKHQTEPPPRLPANFPAPLSDFLCRCLAKDAAERPPDAATFAAELMTCSADPRVWRGEDATKRTLDAPIASPTPTPQPLPLVATQSNPPAPPLSLLESERLHDTTPPSAKGRSSSLRRCVMVAAAGLVIGSAVAVSAVVTPHRVKIESQPPGATVVLDGGAVGITPMELNAIDADSSATLQLRGFETVSLQAEDVVEGRLFAKLEPATVQVTVDPPVEGMNLELGGTPFGTLSDEPRTFLVSWPDKPLRIVLTHPQFADYVEVLPETAIDDEITIAPPRSALAKLSAR